MDILYPQNMAFYGTVSPFEDPGIVIDHASYERRGLIKGIQYVGLQKYITFYAAAEHSAEGYDPHDLLLARQRFCLYNGKVQTVPHLSSPAKI